MSKDAGNVTNPISRVKTYFVKALLVLSLSGWVSWVFLYYYVASYNPRSPDSQSGYINAFNYKGATIYLTTTEDWLISILFYGSIVLFIVGAYLNRKWKAMRRPEPPKKLY